METVDFAKEVETIKEEAVIEKGEATKTTDIAIVIDTTSSLQASLQSIRTAIKLALSNLDSHFPSSTHRFAIISISDYVDPNVLKKLDFTSDVNQVKTFLDSLETGLGGDTPEAYELALRVAATDLKWTSPHRGLVFIGDSYPHPPSYTDQGIFWEDQIRLLSALKVRGYGLQIPIALMEEPTWFFRTLSCSLEGYHLNLESATEIEAVLTGIFYNVLDLFQDYEKNGIIQVIPTLAAPYSISSPRKRPNYVWIDRTLDPGRQLFKYDAVTGKYQATPINFRRVPKKYHVAPVETNDPAPIEVTATPGFVKQTSKQKLERRTSEESPKKSKTTSKKKEPIWVSPPVNVGQDIAINGGEEDLWFGRVLKTDRKSVNVQWFAAISSIPNAYVLLPWKDSIPKKSVVVVVSLVEDPSKGVFLLKNEKLPV